MFQMTNEQFSREGAEAFCKEADEKRAVVSPVHFIHHLIRRRMGNVDEMKALVQRPSAFPAPGLSQL